MNNRNMAMNNRNIHGSGVILHNYLAAIPQRGGSILSNSIVGIHQTGFEKKNGGSLLLNNLKFARPRKIQGLGNSGNIKFII